jgi:hypothetical protein
MPNQAFCPTCGTAQPPVPAQTPAAVPAPAPVAPVAAPYQAADQTPPGEPPANPYYTQPPWGAMPPAPAPNGGGINPLFVIVGGLVVIALIVAGIAVVGMNRNNSDSSPIPSHVAVASSTSAAPSASLPSMTGGITFSPATVDCAIPVAFTTTITLPSTVKSGDTVVIKFDGTTLGTTTISAGGSTTLEADGSWLDVSTATVSGMQTDCANGGMSSSNVAVLTPGTHLYQVLNESGTILAQGSYTVTGSLTTSSPNPSLMSITYSPQSLTCSAPVAWQATFRLPASVLSGDTVVEKIDGTEISSGPMQVDSTTTHETDGTWTVVSSFTVSDIQSICDNSGLNGSGVAVMTVGTHNIQVFDSNDVLLAQGSYTVTP